MPRRVPPLTDRQVLNAKARSKTCKLSDGGGLYLEMTPGGSRLWKFKYRRHGKPETAETRMAFGAYPEITLAEARKQREVARRQLALGEDHSRVL